MCLQCSIRLLMNENTITKQGCRSRQGGIGTPPYMFLSSVLMLLKIKVRTPQNFQFCYSPVVIKKYASNNSKKLYLFCSCYNHFIDMALRKSLRQIIFFAKVFDSTHRKSSYVWVIFIQNFTYFGIREILLQQLTKKQKSILYILL